MRYPIHRPAPPFSEQSTRVEVFETGIKVVDLLAPYPKGGKIVWEWHVWDHLIQDFDPEAENYGDVTAHPELIDINADHRSEPPMDEKALRAQEEMLRRMRELGYVGDEEGEEQERDRRRGGPRTGTDWLHTNAVSYLPEHDLIALSIHTLSEIWVIDHSTTTAQAAGSEGGRYGHGGDLLYRWGNPRTYGAGNEASQILFHQHDVRWLESEDGKLHVTVFNNGEGRRTGRYSSVDELVLPFDAKKGFTRATGKAFGPEKPCWSYSTGDETFFSNFISGAHRLPNGNTLICSGAQNRVFEVTGGGEVVWDYFSAEGGGGGPRGRGRGDGPPDWRDGPPGGFPPGDGPPDGDDRGGDSGGERGEGPGRRGPGGRQGGPGRGPGGGPGGLFRATRIAMDYPGLVELRVKED